MFWHRACWFRAGAQAHIRARNLCMRTKSLEVRSQSACIAFKRTVGSVLCELVGPRIRNQRKCVAATPARRRAMSRARERVYPHTSARTHLSPHAHTRAPPHARVHLPSGPTTVARGPGAQHSNGARRHPGPSQAIRLPRARTRPCDGVGGGRALGWSYKRWHGFRVCWSKNVRTHTHERTRTRAVVRVRARTHTHTRARILSHAHART